MAEKLSKEDIELFNFIINDPESGEAEKKIAREVLEKDNSLKEKPKSTKATPKKKSVSKKTSKPKMSDIEKKKMEILKKTGKTEEECKKIIEQYRALKSEAVTKRKKDTKRKIVAKKRTAKLKKEGKTIQGTTEKNVEATLDTTSKKVVKKIDKEIDKIEKTSKTEKQVEKKISSLVTQAVRSNKKLLSDTAKELAKVDKNNAKQYLLSLKKEIETLLSKYAYGGSVERRGHGGMMHSQGYNDRLDESLGNRNRDEPLMMQSFKDRRDESKGMEKSMGRRPYSSVGTMDKMAKGGKLKRSEKLKLQNKLLNYILEFRPQNGEVDEIADYLAEETNIEKNKIKTYLLVLTDGDTTMYFAKGGKIGFDGLARKVAKRYEGEPVPKRFQKEYGKTYSKAEALEVGQKVAGKVLREQNAKMEAGGTLPTPFGQAGLVGETGTLNEVDLFAMGGTLPQGVHQYYAQTYNPAYPTPFGYARGGGVSNKIYELKYYFVDITEEDYEMGEEATLQSFTSDDMQETGMKFQSKGKALDFVANVIERDTEQYPNESNLEVEQTEKDGHYSITYSTLAVYNMGNYEKPSESQFESFRKGEMRLYSVTHHFVFDVYMKQPSSEFAHGGMMHSQGYNDRLDESLGNRNRVEPLMMQSFKDRRDESKGMEKSMGRRPYSSVGTMDKMAKGGRIKVGDAVISMKDNFPKTIGMGKRETGIVQDLIKGDDGDVAVVDASNGRIVYAKAKNLETLDTLIRDLEKGGMMKSQGYNDKLDDSLGSSNGKRSKKQQNYKDRRDESEAMAKKGGRRKYSRVKTMDKGNRKKRKTPMTLAKEIRKEGEKWQDAVKRASAMLKNK